MLEQFRSYLSRPDVREIAFNIIPSRGQHSILKSKWFCPVRFDPDEKDHAGLAELASSVRSSGTILIPTDAHILGAGDSGPPSPATKALMERFDEEDIEVLALKCQIGDLRYDLYSEYIEPGKVDPQIFELMPEIARHFVGHLRRAVMSGKRDADWPGRAARQ